MTRSSRLLVGSAIVVVGLLLLLDTTGVVETGGLLRWVPSLVVLFGVFLAVRSGFRDLFGPALLVFFGIAWQVSALGIASFGSVFARFWPLLLIALGASILLRPRRTARPLRTNGGDAEIVAVLGDANRRVESPSFASGSVTAILGDARIDLRDADGERPLHLDAVSVLGDARIRVPEGWRVDVDAVSVLGDVSDDRPRTAERSAEPDLVVSGVAVLGDIHVED
ncbi:LiaF domain-containing protein [Haloarculaceae archaeon H-GB2-1]|nr:LiaF-related protein [Haloarculaceae archaeon H-GB1-1]MEA5387751.1 LiaF domain-containing protein [Haloarculaceae archaeon H-GB11]MEA5409243.1 LiaF domain-containing protein [Haloarculaceae archaeon H-GB2-1]